ncbi:DUF2586 domain-containing protein [Pseudomonas sp. URIL14HWK12:I5]|uniref:DUF2586 domain-containing protein n=1 Tax=Pseudomonas sp. URIL14HWK12:I5 TaxID=1261630 RepID=UPI0009D86590|nr:DUF2586 domain-containing protein [Pseudomonas sp. URIL14HWK12:I5]SMD00606.1 Protein of unknown function [Pseudomonas sp. URIL14HWK12:I5]
MALGKVSVNNLNLGQGAVTEVERYFLYIGAASKNVGQILALNQDSDLDVQLGVAASELKTQINAARLNGGDRWACLAMPVATNGSWQDALAKAMQHGYSVEAVVITKPVTAGAELTAMNEAAVAIGNTYARRLFVMAATAGILPTQTWSEYQLEQKAITDSLLLQRVMVVPQLHGSNLGVLAGRLANAAVSVADSPMRVATGPVLGLGETPIDKDGIPLQTATLTVLDAARLSVPQTYADYPGVYWGDGNLLDAPGSDYQVIENLRVVDKAARRVRILLIQRIADRRLNNSANSMAKNITSLMAPLRAMAKSTTVGDQVFPGEITQPKDGDIVINWLSKTAVVAYLTLRPLNCPKDITANIALDLSNDDSE